MEHVCCQSRSQGLSLAVRRERDAGNKVCLLLIIFTIRLENLRFLSVIELRIK